MYAQADAGDVEKMLAVDAPEVDPAGSARGDHPARLDQTARDLERAGEVVGRAERQDAKRQPGFDQGVGSGIEGAVPTADDDQVGLGAVR